MLLGKLQHIKKEWIELAKKPQKRRKTRYGSIFLGKVKGHKRRVPGKLKKAKIKSFTRVQRNLGPAGPIKKQFIYSIRLLMDMKKMQDFQKRFRRAIFGSIENMIKVWQQLPSIVESGIIGGMQIWQKEHKKFVPQRTGTLRKELESSLLQNKPRGEFKFPYLMRVGVPLKYASIVDRMPRSYQLAHQPGKTTSSGRSYFADKGDPDAEYDFFDKFKVRIRNATKKGIKEAANRKNIGYRQVTFFLLESPPFL